MQTDQWRFWIDVGGTFTDCVACAPSGELRAWKTLSSGRVKGRVAAAHVTAAGQPEGFVLTDPLRSNDPVDFYNGWTLELFCESSKVFWKGTVVACHPVTGITVIGDEQLDLQQCRGLRYELSSDLEAPVVCVRRILELPLTEPLPPLEMRLGTTRGTNALLERKGAKTAFVTTLGFGDILQIGSQERPDLFALTIQKPAPLAALSLEIDERLNAYGDVLKRPDLKQVQLQLRGLRMQGFEAIAICFLHAYRNPAHELLVEELASEVGFTQISRSSAVAPLIKLVSRAETTVLDAYLTPVLRTYVTRIQEQLGPHSRFHMLTSAGGLVAARHFSGKDSILSGPAGGVIGYSRIATAAGISQAIGFDMGGTSTDVSRYGGQLELETETRKAGVRIMTPTLAIETVAAGGGSLCTFDGVQLRVGPESAGSQPGPACYGRGGPLTVTDLNLALGRLLPDRFPFPLDAAAVQRRLHELCVQLQQSPLATTYTPHELAQGFIEIANETMARAIRRISIQRGFHPAEHVLVCFGGSGGLHACALARQLNISRILVHPFAGILSAYGIGLANRQRQTEFSVLRPLTVDVLVELNQQLEILEHKLTHTMTDEGHSASQIQAPHRQLTLRYQGVEAALTVPWISDQLDRLQAVFESQHQQYYGYLHAQRELEIVSVRTIVSGATAAPDVAVSVATGRQLIAKQKTDVWFGAEQLETAVFNRDELQPGDELAGPVLICDATSTILVEPHFRAFVNERQELELQHVPVSQLAPRLTTPHDPPATHSGTPPADPILLEIFNNQFASIAEQMGVTLQRTAVSTNVKERLDYSCAVFDALGGLVVNAPHIPVHLGAMSETVRGIIADNPSLAPGDVYLTNDPYRGGSHLPDITVVTPVHHPESRELLFFTASRAHHAEIGGIAPGSMPPFSKSLAEEGVLLRNFRLISGENTRQTGYERLAELLHSGPFPSRNVPDNLSDIAAQVAANHLGAQRLLHLIQAPPGDAGHDSVQYVLRYMQHIQHAASIKMKLALERYLSQRAPGQNQVTLNFADYLDDGACIRVQICTQRTPGKNHEPEAGPPLRATLDFTGTDPVLATNLNANRAIVTAAVMYVFRCLIDDPIPLNSGVLEPLEIILPECLLNPPAHADPAACAAMVGGNVETSQRVVDVLLGALGIAAASQGTMNNLTFGDYSFGYYETICGGAGATAQGPGADAVHTHMTNTRLTDVEIIEHRYPVRIHCFAIRHGSGGAGVHCGGAGVIREFEFLKPVTVSLVTQRRGPYAPYGLAGGQSGACGRNLTRRAADEEWQLLPSAARLEIQPGDRVRIETPGGGGWQHAAPNTNST